MKLILISPFFLNLSLADLFIFSFLITPPVIAAGVTRTNTVTAATNATATTTSPTNATTPKTHETAKQKKPQVLTSKTLKENQYSLDKDNKITIFSTQLYDGLLLSEHCFKNTNIKTAAQSQKPTCEAYTKSLQKPAQKAEDNLPTPYNNNLGSIHCKLIGGTGLIAKSHKNNESDFCEFKDGSIVSSWSAYYKITQNQANQNTSAEVTSSKTNASQKLKPVKK